MKKFMHEFKIFVMRGNVMELAVGVIIGGAFQKIVNSLVNDIIMPIVTLITGGINFTDWFIALDGNNYETLAQAQESGAATLNYGSFITEILIFLIMAIVIFFMVKTINKLSEPFKQEISEQAPDTKCCPYCKSQIAADASRCPHCTSVLDDK